MVSQGSGLGKIKDFTDLYAWKEAHALVLVVYKATKQFPAEEKFCLIDQARRAVISVTSNIAEGFGRSSGKDKRYFYTMAKTSLAELRSQFFAARDLGYLSTENFQIFIEQSVKVGFLLAS
jgi:four helix bundle protein